MKKVMKKAISLIMAVAVIISAVVPAMALQAEEKEVKPFKEPIPVLKVDFDKSTAADESGNGNDGVVVGNPEFVDGVSGKAIHLVNSTNRNDPARQYVNFGEPEDLKFGEDNFTVMFWYKADPAKTTEGAIVSNKHWVSGGNKGFTIGDMKEGVTLNFTAESGGRRDTSRDPAATDNEWHHVAAVIDRTENKEMTLYIDGIVAKSGVKSLETAVGSIDVTDFVLGASNKDDGSKFLAVADSYIDELQVYKEALTKEEIRILGKLPELPEPETVLKVSFDENTADDESGNGNNGVVVGNPEFVDGVSGNAIHLVNSEDRNAEALQYVNFGQKEKLKFGKYDFSVMFWYKADSASQTEGAIIGNKYWVSGGNPGFTIGDMKNGITLNMNTPGCSRKDTGRYSAATDNEWHHVAAVIDRTNTKTMALYIDGAVAGNKVDISGLSGSVDVADFLLGASNKADGTKFLAVDDSYIDELSVFNYAISEDKITNEVSEYTPNLEIKEMSEIVSEMETGERYSEEMISEMTEKINTAKAELEKEEADKEAVLADLKEEYEKFLEGNPSEMSFHLISDTHITSDANAEAARYLETALQDMKKVNPAAKGFLTAGDNTQDGRDTEVKVFYDILNEFNPVEDDQMLIALGNHDVRGPNSWQWEEYPVEPNAYWETAYNLYMNSNQKYMPDTNGATYYDRWIEGYHFIVLNPENAAKDTAWMTDSQLNWLEEKLSENESPDKPVFVITHQALNDTHSGSNNYLGFGNQDARVKEILKNHPQTVFISGHIHNGIGAAEVMDSTYGTLIDVPSFRWNGSGNTGAGIGYEVYMYDTEMYLRARDFVNHKWLPKYDVSVRIPTLPSLCKKTDELIQSDYTEESWAAADAVISEVLPEAKDILLKTYGNFGKEERQRINEVQCRLTEGLNLLEKAEKADKTTLEALIKYAESQKLHEDYQYVIPAVKKAFEAALAEALAVNEDANATQAEIDTAYEKLLDMTHYLGFTGDSKLLKVTVDAARKLVEEVYTEETWAPFAKALAEAEAVLANENSLQAEIDVANEVLGKAMAALVKKPVNKDKLQNLVNKSQKYVDKLDQYTDLTGKLFGAALAEANKVLADDNATQAEVDNAYAALQNAIFGLRLIPDKDKLEGLIKDAEAVDTADYTAESVAAFKAALDHAKVVFADGDATEELVKAAEKALKKAQKNLVAKADADKGSDKVASTDGSNKTAAKTGDTAPIVSMIVIMLGAATGGILVCKRRKMR